MKKSIFKHLFAAGFAFIAAGAGAQMKTSYFMEGSIPRYDMNAALTPMHGYVNMPFMGAIGVNVNNNFLSLDNFIYPYQDRHVLFMHESVNPKTFLNRMPNRASLNSDITYNIIGVGKYSRKHNHFWSFGLNIRAVADAGIPKEVFSLLKDFRNGTYDIPDVTLGAMLYAELSLGFAKPVGWQDLVVGGRLKLLMGAGQAEATLDNISITSTENQVKASFGGSMRASVFGYNFNHLGSGQFEMGDLFGDFRFGDGFKSYGAAIDIGAEMKLFDRRLKVSFALNDLGFIRWSAANAVNARMDDFVIEFNGINLNKDDGDEKDDFEVADPAFRKTGSQGYGKRLSTVMNIGAEYTFFDNLLGVGLLSNTRFSNRITYSELTLIGTVRPADWFTAAVSHTLVHNKIGIFGLALNFHPKAVNFFLGVDYIPTRFAEIREDILPVTVWPVRTKSLNFSFGLAFGVGRSKPWGDVADKYRD